MGSLRWFGDLKLYREKEMRMNILIVEDEPVIPVQNQMCRLFSSQDGRTLWMSLTGC